MGRHSLRGLSHELQHCSVLRDIDGTVKAVLFAVKFVLLHLKLEDLFELGDFGGGGDDGIRDAADWC